MIDSFYSQFEQSFRGQRTEIKERLQVYSPFLEPLIGFYPDGLAVDLGCGRGEWLEILRDKGFTVLGVDLDDGMLADCRALGLNVETQDAIDALRTLEDASCTIVSAFHLVEHIPFDVLRTLVSEALRVLKPGGILLMETPNPENVTVGTSSFYLDPTHTRPIPPGLLSFIPKYYGFYRTIVLRLQESSELLNNPSPTLHNVLSGASPDFAVIAQKSAEPKVLVGFDSVFSLDLGLTIETLSSRYDHSAIRKVSESNHAIRQEITQSNQAIRQEISETSRSLAESSAQGFASITIRLDTTDQTLNALAEKLDSRTDSIEASISKLNQQIHDVYNSTSWRVTRPLRAMANGLRRIKRLLTPRQP